MVNNKSKENVLIITMNWFGGSTIFMEQYIKQNLQNKGIFILLQNNDKFNVIDLQNKGLVYNVEKNPAHLTKLIQSLKITSIFINHLATFDLQFIINWILNLKIPFTFFMHDYFCVCPSYNIDCFAKFCSENETNIKCRKHFNDVNLPKVTIKNWRYVFEQFLTKAEHIYIPSTYAANIVKNFYPNLNIESKPHYLSLPLKKTFNPKFAERDRLRMFFLGNMWKHKGERYLLLANEFIRKQNLPIEFLVAGEYHDEIHEGTKEGILYIGKYDNKKVSNLLSKLETAIVANLSNVYETYCYTASEAILSGYPVLAMDIGAHSVRIKKNDCGWIIPINTPSNGFEELKSFLKFIVTPEGRKQILLKAANTNNFKNGME